MVLVLDGHHLVDPLGHQPLGLGTLDGGLQLGDLAALGLVGAVPLPGLKLGPEVGQVLGLGALKLRWEGGEGEGVGEQAG